MPNKFEETCLSILIGGTAILVVIGVGFLSFLLYRDFNKDETKIELYAEEWSCIKSRMVSEYEGRVLVHTEKCLVWERKGM